MAEKLITLNEDDDKKNNQILSNNVDVTAPENIKKQKTDEDLKISKNLIDDKEKVIEEDEAIQLEDITETSEILPGDALFNNVEEIVNAQDSNQDVFEIYQDLDFTKEQINAISDNHKKTKKFKKDNELIEIYQDLGIDPENILKSINKRNNKEILYNNPEITQPIDDYWDGVLDDISEWAVGNDADWGTYFERGLGKSNINLALQYHLDRGIDYNKVFTAEPGDTGALERALETVTGIVADLPTFAFGGLGGAYLTGGNPFGAAFGAGFLNDSIKEMYIQALESDTPPDSFADWWNIFSHHGLSRGIEGGINMVGLVGGQKVAAQTIGKLPGVNKYISDFVGRFAGLTLVGSAYNEGELPSKDELVNNAIVLGLFGTLEGALGGKGGVRAYISKKNLKMLNESAKINKVTLKEKVNEILKDSTKLK